MTRVPFPTLAGSRRVATQGPGSPAQVWRRYITYAEWPTWSPQVRDVHVAGGPSVAAGQEGVVRGPAGLLVPFVVEDVDDERRRWAWRVQVAGVALRMEHGVDEAGTAGETGSTAWVVLHGPWPVVTGYAVPAGLALRRLVRASPT